MACKIFFSSCISSSPLETCCVAFMPIETNSITPGISAATHRLITIQDEPLLMAAAQAEPMADIVKRPEPSVNVGSSCNAPCWMARLAMFAWLPLIVAYRNMAPGAGAKRPEASWYSFSLNFLQGYLCMYVHICVLVLCSGSTPQDSVI